MLRSHHHDLYKMVWDADMSTSYANPDSVVQIRDGDAPDLVLTPADGINLINAAGEQIYNVFSYDWDWVHASATSLELAPWAKTSQASAFKRLTEKTLASGVITLDPLELKLLAATEQDVICPNIEITESALLTKAKVTGTNTGVSLTLYLNLARV